jgi:hypothetical protein
MEWFYFTPANNNSVLYKMRQDFGIIYLVLVDLLDKFEVIIGVIDQRQHHVTILRQCTVWSILVTLCTIAVSLVAFGILMHCSSHNSILLGIHMIHFSSKVKCLLLLFSHQLDVNIFYWSSSVCSPCYNNTITRRLSWESEASTSVWWLWLQRVCCCVFCCN